MRCGLMKITVRGISFSFDGGTGKRRAGKQRGTLRRMRFSLEGHFLKLI